MNRAVQAAERLALRYGRDPWEVANALDVLVLAERLPRSVSELYLAAPDNVHAILLDKALSTVKSRELLAHGLAHHILHVGNYFTTRPTLCAHEREADDFAAALLVDGVALAKHLRELDPPSDAELAWDFEVSIPTVRRRLRLLAGVDIVSNM